MGTRTMVRSISGILLIFLFFAGVIIASTGASAAAQSGITKKIRIVLPSEPDTLDLMSTKMPGVSGCRFCFFERYKTGEIENGQRDEGDDRSLVL